MARPILHPGESSKYVLQAKQLVVAHLTKLKKPEMASAINVKSKTYGSSMEDGVRLIQRRYKIKVDGVIGPQTWKVLDYAKPARRPLPAVTIVPRNEWGAKPARGVKLVAWTPKTPTRVHHTVSAMPSGSGKDLFEAEKEAVREIQKYHMNTRKYNDIAYNFIIAPSGRVFECRGKNVEGAHTLGHNSDCGVAFLGNYDKDQLTRAQIIAYRVLRSRLGISKGTQMPHKATSATSCPGSNVVKQLGL